MKTGVFFICLPSKCYDRGDECGLTARHILLASFMVCPLLSSPPPTVWEKVRVSPWPFVDEK